MEDGGKESTEGDRLPWLIGREHLDPLISHVGHVDVALVVHTDGALQIWAAALGHQPRSEIELPGSIPRLSPLGHVLAVRIKCDDPLTRLGRGGRCAASRRMGGNRCSCPAVV